MNNSFNPLRPKQAPFKNLPLPPSPLQVIKALHPHLKTKVRYLPFDMIRRPMESLMRSTFAELIEYGELDFLKGQWLEIAITDMNISWFITMGANGPIMVESAVEPKASIRGQLKDFVALANAELDPDTLFFQRRLMIDGDTEMGLMVKNTLFAVEIQGLAKSISRFLQRALDLVEPA